MDVGTRFAWAGGGGLFLFFRGGGGGIGFWGQVACMETAVLIRKGRWAKNLGSRKKERFFVLAA